MKPHKANLTKSEIARRRLIAGGETSAEKVPTGFDLLTDLVGTDITNSVLQTSDGDYKGVDEYTIDEVMQAAYDNADCPPMTDVLEQLINVLHYTFDF